MAIADYLKKRSPSGARSVEEKIRSTVALLQQFPESGRALEQRQDVRVLPTAKYPYLIFYTVTQRDLLVLHIRHGARAPVRPDEL